MKKNYPFGLLKALCALCVTMLPVQNLSAQIGNYCVPSNNTNTQYYITGVYTTGAEANFSNLGTGFSGFTDYTNQYSVSTYAGASFDLTATHPADQIYIYGAWVDWNRDSEFSANEMVVNTGIRSSPANLGTIIVPVDAEFGAYRLRIRNVFRGVPQPCADHIYGEAEDYTINVVDMSGCYPPFGLSALPESTTSLGLTWNEPILGPTPLEYQYVVSNSPTPPAEGSGERTTDIFAGNVTYNPEEITYIYLRSICPEGVNSMWVTTTVLNTASHNLLDKSIKIYSKDELINITSENTSITAVSIYDIRGSKIYSLEGNNKNEIQITNLNIQKQVLLAEISTPKGKVVKKLLY